MPDPKNRALLPDHSASTLSIGVCGQCKAPVHADLCSYGCPLDNDSHLGHVEKRVYVLADDIEKMLREVSRDYAGAHVNAGSVVGTVRKRLREIVGGQQDG